MSNTNDPKATDNANKSGHFNVHISAGRDNRGAFAIGKNSTATATITDSSTSEQPMDITGALQALRDHYSNIPGIDAKALTRLDEAKDEASKDTANPSEVTDLVDQAVRYASRAASFAGSVEKVAPLLHHVWNWAGATLPDWAATLGLR